MASLPKMVEEGKEEEGEEERVVWVKHYSSIQEILLVGEGDFSFSVSLANSFGSASNIVATSLDSREALVVKYSTAKENLESLEKMGATVLYGIDATKMKLHTDLRMRRFDRIVYNFPHAGFKGKEDQVHLINLHRQLVLGFFNNASRMLRPSGEVHVTHKTQGPFRKWNLEELASKNSLVLFERADFKIEDYPGYNNKRGDGARCDQPFPLGKCSTFKFIVCDVRKMKKAAISNVGSVCGRSSTDTVDSIADGLRNISRTEHPLAIQYPQGDYMSNIWRRPQTDFTINVEGMGIPEKFYHPWAGTGIVPMMTYENHLEEVRRFHGRVCPGSSYATQGVGGNVYMNGVNDARCGTAYAHRRYPQELGGWSGLRTSIQPIMSLALARELGGSSGLRTSTQPIMSLALARELEAHRNKEILGALSYLLFCSSYGKEGS